MQLPLSAFVVVLAASAPSAGAQGLQAVSAEIAPNRTLRVGFQTASPILAKRAADGTLSGVAVDLGRFIADTLGVAFEPVAAIASAITPVPGGVGPMTIAMLLKNTLQAAELTRAG